MDEKIIIHREDLCIWHDRDGCKNCNLNGQLHCHPEKSLYLWFASAYLSSSIPAFIGLIMIDGILKWISLGVWFGYMVIFFQFWEPFILCSHCPFYAEENTKILHCPYNYGFYKITRYNPEPISRFEQIQFIIGIILLMGIPFPFLALFDLWIPLGLSLAGTLFFALVLRNKTCTECINFSCIFNRVDEEKKKAFLERNPKLGIYLNENAK